MKGAYLGLFVWMLSATTAIAAEPPGGGPHTPTQPPGTFAAFNLRQNFTQKSAGTIALKSNWGNLTVDTVTNRAYLATSSGVREFTVNSALTAAGLNPSAFNFQQAYPGLNRTVLSMDDDWGPNQVIGPCALSPCFIDWDPVDGNRILVDLITYNPPPGPDARLVEDMRGYRNWREGRCDEFDASVVQSSVESAPVSAGCVAIETGIGGLVCAGGLIKQAYDASRRAGQMTDCHSSYPGPGKWPGSTLPQGYGQ